MNSLTATDFLPNHPGKTIHNRLFQEHHRSWWTTDSPCCLPTCNPPSYQIILDQPGTCRSQATLTTNFWQWGYSVPDQDLSNDAYDGPFNDPTGVYAGLNQSGSVFFLAGPLFVDPENPSQDPITRDLEVPTGNEIFFPVMNVEWDNPQLQAFFGEGFFTDLPDEGILSPDELRILNEACMATATDMFCIVDGDTLFADADWGDDDLLKYRQVTPTPEGFTFTIPENNALGLPLEATDNGKGLIEGAMSDGIWVHLKLAPGLHEISFGGVFNFGSIDVDFNRNGVCNEEGKELAYQKALQQYGTLVLDVNNNIHQL